ncbi:uncharacterized protein LAESUDRAFT_718098 [Laetiporus sulphureus 93-53]|uniref:Uncharacterized protein n=1 Tax=Laetiporus sulphureus 93-53 TaxID=1314785 RepID=A0A165B8I7_9APHY|nr:uncharacterized protein LAESUDRAFT_718098 [Laetiporus sulphureus 93-53]KZT00489.1 hypothetical protein LAESUDRAFT_718098 [Laetiporus sulphureus 93-53]
MATRPLFAQKAKVHLGSVVPEPAECPHSNLRGFSKPVAVPPLLEIWGSAQRLGRAQMAVDIQAEIATLKQKLAKAEATVIEPGSYLEAVFKQLTGGGDGPPGDSSPSSDSSSDSSSSDDESSDNTPFGNARQGVRKHYHAKKRKSRVPVLKPREPSSYDGKSDVQEFHKFMREMTEY